MILVQVKVLLTCVTQTSRSSEQKQFHSPNTGMGNISVCKTTRIRRMYKNLLFFTIEIINFFGLGIRGIGKNLNFPFFGHSELNYLIQNKMPIKIWYKMHRVFVVSNVTR